MATLGRIVPCLWFDSQAEDAATFYVTVFPNSRIDMVTHYGKEGFEIHGQKAGTVLTVEFQLDGQAFTALNGGPAFKFTEAISLQVICESQDEIDHYWAQLSEGGDPNAQQCGWLKDRYGLSWQVTPSFMAAWMTDPDQQKTDRVMKVLLQMKKLDITQLKMAYEG
jgi:predicted 3-demethylubiquinone-9 3-methyltransferase (glyoxalase superfamily)